MTNFGGEKPTGPSTSRIAIWVIGAALGLYFLISGIVGLVSGGA